MLGIVRAASGALGQRLLYNLLYMLGLVALVLPFALWAPPILRLVAAALIWLGGSAYAAGRRDDQTDGWAIVCAAVPAMVIGYGLGDYLALARGQHVAGISAAEAPAYAKAAGFDFSDSVVQIKYAATYRTSSRDRKSGRITYYYYHVAPLTESGWTPADPVPAWAGCGDQYSGLCAEWFRLYRGGVAVESHDWDGLRIAADQALARHQLREAPGAPLLERVASAEQGQRQRGQTLLLAPLFAYLLWALPISLHALWNCAAELWRYARA
jgi:hypothetical protein